MREVGQDGRKVMVETLLERTEWYIRDHPGCSEFEIGRNLGNRAVSCAWALYSQGIVKSWRDDIATRNGKAVRGYRYQHIFRSNDNPVSREVIALDA